MKRIRKSALASASVRIGCALWVCAGLASAQEPPPPAEPPGDLPSEPTPPPAETPPEPPPPAEPPQPGSTPLSDELWAELEAYVASLLPAFDVPGAAVALIQNNQVQRIGTYGVLGVEDPAPVDARTRFMIGSLTKSMTTTLAATLVSEGRLDWDDPVADYLPDFALSSPEWTPLVRVRDAFGHTSGVPRYDIPLFIDAHRPRGLIASIADIPSLAAPGERFDYQNQVFAVGGYALARAAGARNDSRDLTRTFERLLKRRVFKPLRMTRTTLDFDTAMRDDNHAFPHALDAATSVASPVHLGFERFASVVAPAGAVWASIDDMARYLAMHLRDGESVEGVRVVDADALAETHTAQTVLDGSTGYGLGWGVGQTDTGVVLSHTGGTAGFTSQLVALPSLDFGVAILTNSTDGFSLSRAVSNYLAELVFGLPHRGDADLLAEHAQFEAALAGLVTALEPVDADSVAAYLGRYERELTVSHQADHLIIETAHGAFQFQQLPDVEGIFMCTTNFYTGFLAQFLTDEQGQVTLALGFVLENDTITSPLLAARLDGASPPHHPNHPGHHARAHRLTPNSNAPTQRAFNRHEWNQALRQLNTHPRNLNRPYSAPTFQ